MILNPRRYESDINHVIGGSEEYSDRNVINSTSYTRSSSKLVNEESSCLVWMPFRMTNETLEGVTF